VPAHGLNHDKENNEILIDILACQPLTFFENKQVPAAALVEELTEVVAFVSQHLYGLRVDCFTWNNPNNKAGLRWTKRF